MERSMIGFRYGRGRGRVFTTRTRLPQRLVLLAIIALVTTSLGATSSLASPSGRAETNCKIVVAGAPWKVATHAGSSYTLAARGMSCAMARPWAMKLTRQTAGPTGKKFKGPSGFTCQSFSTAASGDKLLYSGVCMKGPHNHPFFEWGPKV
jgi:hypothetical protein